LALAVESIVVSDLVSSLDLAVLPSSFNRNGDLISKFLKEVTGLLVVLATTVVV
jgi:hypothetical protein